MVRDEAQDFASRSPERQLIVRLDPGVVGQLRKGRFPGRVDLRVTANRVFGG
jgi:hypothetical protein